MALSLNRRERNAVLFLGAAHAMTHSMMLVFPAILIPLMEEFDLELFGIGVLGNIGYFLFGAGALPAGFLADRLGPGKILLFFFAGGCLSCLIIFSSSGIISLALGLLLSGASASLYHPAGLSYITRRVRARGKALGYHGMAGNIGLAAAPLLAAWTAVSFGWRYIYLVLALIFGVMALVNWRSSFWDETKVGVGDDRNGGELIPTEKTERIPLVVLYLIMILAGFVYRGALTYLPAYMSTLSPDGRGWDLSISGAGTMTTVALMLGIFSQWMGGHLSQRFRLEPLGFVIILFTLPFLFFMAYTGGMTLMLMSAFFVFFYFFWQPVSNGLVAQYTHKSFRSLAFGLSFSLSFGAGSFASSIAGKIGDVYGLDRVFFFLAILLSVILVLSLVLVVLARGKRAGDQEKAYSY
jgi:MFS family permease